ncbi:MAG TPA: Scr1 family TA system antitoxin-like transcriptional regulator [Candidatus Saccharimonadales bacterium]
MAKKGPNHAFRPLFDIPAHYTIPRTGTKLVEIAQHLDYVMQQVAVETVRADSNSTLHCLPSVGIPCSGSLQTPELIEEILVENTKSPAAHEFRLGRALLLLEKKVPQKQIVRERSIDVFTDAHPHIGKTVMANQFEYLLAADDAYDFLEIRVLPKTADEETLKDHSGYMIFNHNDGRYPNTFATLERPNKDSSIVDQLQQQHANAHVQQAFDIALSPEESRDWLRTTAAKWQQ